MIGKQPPEFSHLPDFETYVWDSFGSDDQGAKQEQRRLLDLALREAKASRAHGVATCLFEIIRLQSRTL